ncbi:procathepsin L-like [Corticium candelabrum]|uniref:procathepsin L-like n=1 Tax=Corticium candelabrum TaxID=121492 RepID=UPI002E259C91|nr:procathepsin L-like [Corticium candelabrum]
MKLATLITCLALAHSLPSSDWQTWKTENNKVYTSDEEERYRYSVWKDNLQYVTEQNKILAFELGMNYLADMTHEEYVETLLGYRGSARNSSRSVLVVHEELQQLPTEVDWRTKGYVTEIKNQGACGSCWAFSATGSLEGQHFKKTGELVSLSEQNLMDCSQREGNQGCKGGLMDNAFKYVEKNKGIDTEASYPYKAKDEVKCHFKLADVGATCSGFTDIPKDDENALQEAVATIGPISVAIDASHRSFQLYRNGIYYEPKCSEKRLDHGVLAVGYGSEGGDGGEGDYWLVKNSWGKHWGMQGYVHMSRNRENNCGIATAASYPHV